jgi:phosphate transport system substrate-binding protein
MLILLVLVLSVKNTYSQQPQTNKVIITGTRFTYPIIEKWIAEFKKTHPDVNIALAPLGTSGADSANLKIVSHDLVTTDLKEGDAYIAVAKYGLLSIANSKSPLVGYYKNRGLQEADINKLFFTDNTGTIKNYVVYTRQQKSCAPISFANNYGHSFDDLSGTKIQGDDKALLYALKKDSLGISYNNLGYVYDVNTRKIVDNIAVLPVDLNHNGKIDSDEQFYNSLDEVIAKYETIQNKLLATEDVNVIYSQKSANPNIQLFLNWVLTDGQKYNHAVGFLNFNSIELNKQKIALQK